MSAQNCMNKTQFMSMSDLKGLRSGAGKTVGDVLPAQRRDILENPVYNSVRRGMKESGQTAPLRVNDGTLVDGHHRVAIAEDLGWAGMHVSSGHGQSTDAAFDKKHNW
jgi:hypothetical protein